jgi:rubredoxin
MMKHPKQLLVKCSGCGTIFVRTHAGKEQCGICGDGKERVFKEVKMKVTGRIENKHMVLGKPKKHGKASGRKD